MTLLQLEYAVAVDTYRSFVLAAEQCFVSQPTLSVQVQKLEEYLGVKLFERSRQPVVTTEIGMQVLEQARLVLAEADRIKEIISYHKNDVSGELRMGIIPTVAPYLLPRIIPGLFKKYPALDLKVWEYSTEQILAHIKSGQLDCAILATPLYDSSINEHPLYYENFVAYTGSGSKLSKKKHIDQEDLADERLWLLNDDHCMRSQVLNICNVRQKNNNNTFEYNTGSIETLIRMVDTSGGNTLLPELAANELPAKNWDKLKYFKTPAPAREISLITGKNFIKKRLLQAVEAEVMEILPKSLRSKKKKEIVQL